MNAEMLEAALTADAGTLVVGRRKVKRKRVSAARRAHEDNLAIAELLLHTERLGIESNRTRLVSHQQMDMPNPERAQGFPLATEPCSCCTSCRPRPSPAPHRRLDGVSRWGLPSKTGADASRRRDLRRHSR